MAGGLSLGGIRLKSSYVCANARWRPVGTTIWFTRNVCYYNATLTGLVPGTTYEWQLSNSCPGTIGTSAYTDSRTFTAGTCSSPLITGYDPTSTSTRLEWNYVNTTDQFEVQWRLAGSTSAYNSLTTTGAFVGYGSITGLTPNTSYEFRVRSFCTNGLTSAFSNSTTLRTQLVCQTATAYLSNYTSSTIITGQTVGLGVSLYGDAPLSFTLSDGQTFTGITTGYYTFTVAPTTSTTYTLVRVANSCGNGTLIGSVVVQSIPCTDPYEPNNTVVTATSITSASFTSPNLCLSPAADQDWFQWVYNGKIYYIQVRHYGITGVGPYRLSVNVQGTSLVAATQSVSGVITDTYLSLFASNGTTLLTSNDDFGGTAFSQITYDLSGTCLAATNLNEELITNSSLWLRWTNGSGVQFNTIQIRQTNTTAWTSYTATSTNNLDNLSAGTYEWRVVSTCPNGNTVVSVSRIVEVQCTPPFNRYLLTTTSTGALVGWVGNRSWDPTISYGVHCAPRTGPFC